MLIDRELSLKIKNLCGEDWNFAIWPAGTTLLRLDGVEDSAPEQVAALEMCTVCGRQNRFKDKWKCLDCYLEDLESRIIELESRL